MDIGRLNNKFAILVNQIARDSLTGAASDDYQEAATIWGSLRNPTPREIATKTADDIIISHVIDCRLSETILDNPKTCKLTTRNRGFFLSHFDYDDRQKTMRLYVTEIL